MALKHYLFVRGWWHPSGKQTLDGFTDAATDTIAGWWEELDLGNGEKKRIWVSSSLRAIAEGLNDFANEITQLEEPAKQLGHAMGKTPKCHPEMADEGVELSWGKSAYDSRHNTNTGSVPNLRANVMRALGRVG